MSNDSGKPPSISDAQYQRGIDGYRAIAKWMVSSFGAVAGALVVGIQLTSLGELHGWRLFWTILSVTVVFVAILAIIRAVVPVLVPVRGTYHGFESASVFDPLKDELKDEPAPLRGEASTAGELAKKYEAALAAQRTAWETYQEHANDGTFQGYVNATKAKDQLYDVVVTVTWLGLLLKTQQLFERSMRIMYLALAAAAAGAVAFAHFSDQSASVKVTPPSKVQVTVNQPTPPPKLQVSVNEPKTCVDLYLALDELVRAKPNIGSHWPTPSLGAQDQTCGFHSEKELSRFLSFLANHGP
jgi:hypothetical protein